MANVYFPPFFKFAGTPLRGPRPATARAQRIRVLRPENPMNSAPKTKQDSSDSLSSWRNGHVTIGPENVPHNSISGVLAPPIRRQNERRTLISITARQMCPIWGGVKRPSQLLTITPARARMKGFSASLAMAHGGQNAKKSVISDLNETSSTRPRSLTAQRRGRSVTAQRHFH